MLGRSTELRLNVRLLPIAQLSCPCLICPDDKQIKKIEVHHKDHPEAYEEADGTEDLVKKNEGNDRAKAGRINRWITIALEQLHNI
jgi:hypothetical protein